MQGCQFFGQERNKMKLKGADLEHEQHEALVMHYQVMHYQVKILGLPRNPWISNNARQRLLKEAEVLMCLNCLTYQLMFYQLYTFRKVAYLWI